jgi:hypothetical protein
METGKRGFQFGQYFHLISRVLLNPRAFFAETGEGESWSKPFWTLMVSGGIFSVASVISGMPSNPVFMGMVHWFNAVAMVLIASGLGYGMAKVLKIESLAYPKVFGVYAYASSAVLVLAWMPFMLWITEIWRWWLIGCGLTTGFGIPVKKAVVIIALSVILLALVFHLALSIIR